MPNTIPDVIVIGAGVIGISAALELQTRGRNVQVIDPDGSGQGASFGNAGAFAFTDVLPLATPHIMRKAPLWLFDPLGPLSVPPAHSLHIAPWLWKFWRASRPINFAKAVSAQVSLMSLARAAHDRQIARTDGARLILREGQLQLYNGKQSFLASLSDWELRRQHGIRFDLVKHTDELAQIQPGLSRSFQYGVFTPDWMNTVNPKTWVDHLARCFLQRGGTVERAKAFAIESQADGVVVLTNGALFKARQVVVATGAHSKILAHSLGDEIPLETERGYNTTLPSGAFDLRTQLTFADHGFVVSKLDEGVRVGGSVELGGLKAPANFKRADHMLKKAARFLPSLNTAGGAQWMGFRPSLPDSLPVISHARATRDVVYAFGHGHLGLTQSAATGEIVADLLANATASIPMAPFSAARFARTV